MQRWIRHMAMFVGVFLVWSTVACAQTIGEVSGKLDEVLKNQQEILRQLGELKTELNVVKIRASNR